MSSSTGTLYLVSTPIGNLDDLSPRAKQILSSVAYILCESTDQTRKLGISVPLFRYEGKGYQAEIQSIKVLEDLRSGKNIALVSNAGTPNISDPGLSLVQTTVQEGFSIVHVPGPVAFVSAVVTSGLPTKNILFIGFLPKKEGAIKQKFEKAKRALELLDDPASLVCYVSKYQLHKSLEAVKQVLGDAAFVSVARELTKMYEEHKTGRIDEIVEWLNASKHREKGEFTLAISLTH